MIKLVKLLAEFATVESRIIAKLRPVFTSLIQQQKAKSVTYEVIKTIFRLFSTDDKELYQFAIQTLNKEFLGESDPNLRFSGLLLLNDDLNVEVVQQLYSKMVLHFLKTEREKSLIALLVKIVQKIIEPSNYEEIIKSLFS